MFTCLNCAPTAFSAATVCAEKPHCGKSGVPFMNSTTGAELSSALIFSSISIIRSFWPVLLAMVGGLWGLGVLSSIDPQVKSGLRDDQQRIPGDDGPSDPAMQRSDRPRAARRHRELHFHRLQDHQRLSWLHLLSDFDQHFPHIA